MMAHVGLVCAFYNGAYHVFVSSHNQGWVLRRLCTLLSIPCDQSLEQSLDKTDVAAKLLALVSTCAAVFVHSSLSTPKAAAFTFAARQAHRQFPLGV